MTASTKKVTAKRAELAARRSERAKAAAANSKARKAPSLKAVAKATTKVLDKPAKLSPVAEGFLASFGEGVTAAKARGEKPTPLGLKAIVAKAHADAKPAKGPTGVKAKIIAMIAADGGTSAAEVCKALGWVKAGATISRAIKLAPFKVAKVREADGVLRYSRA